MGIVKIPKFKIRGTKNTVELTDSDFKAQGGEGSIYIIGDIVYKICIDGKMIPDSKFIDLAALDHHCIIKPQDVLLDNKNNPVGYTMKKVPGNSIVLAQMLTKTYREREGISPKTMADLVQQIVDGIKYIHSKPGYLQVDGNELNYMVSNHKDVYFIDVNSYQTPNHPASAIMPNIRDWNAGTNFTKLTDWYSAAIVTWYMFTGIHPYKGTHPKFNQIKTAMIDRMKAGISILDKDAGFPKAAVYFPFENVIPGGENGAYMQWYKAIFLQNKRLPAPDSFQSTINFVAIVKEIVGSNNFDIVELRKYASQIIGYVEKNGREVVITNNNIYANNQQFPKIVDKFRIGFFGDTPIALIFNGVSAKALNIETQSYLYSNEKEFEVNCKDIMSYNGRLFYQSGQYIYELILIGKNVSSKMIASVMPESTKIYQGLAIQDMFSSRIVSVFPEAGHHKQIKIDELVGLEITEAKFENKVLMVVAINRVDGQYTRFIFRFSDNYLSYDIRKIENITPTGINFTVIESGVVICITEEGNVEMFSNKKDNQNIKTIDDPAIKANMYVFHYGNQVRLAHGDKVYSFSIRKN